MFEIQSTCTMFKIRLSILRPGSLPTQYGPSVTHCTNVGVSFATGGRLSEMKQVKRIEIFNVAQLYTQCVSAALSPTSYVARHHHVESQRNKNDSVQNLSGRLLNSTLAAVKVPTLFSSRQKKKRRPDADNEQEPLGTLEATYFNACIYIMLMSHTPREMA